MASRTYNLEGQRFGKLVAVSFAGFVQRGKYTQAEWICRCDCGREVQARAYYLRAGRKTHCGCEYGDGQKAAVTALYRKYAQRAKQAGRPFELTREDFIRIIKSDCHYCGAEPSQCWRRSADKDCYNYNGIDRVNNDAGYTIDNVVPCCGTCNRNKGAMSGKEFKAWIKRVHDHMFGGGDGT